MYLSAKDSAQCLTDYSSSEAIIGLPSVKSNLTNPIIQPSLLGRPKSGLDTFSRFLPQVVHLTAVISHIGLGRLQHELSDSESFLTSCKRIANCLVQGASSPEIRPVIRERISQPDTVHIPKPIGAEPYCKLNHPKLNGINAKMSATQ